MSAVGLYTTRPILQRRWPAPFKPRASGDVAARPTWDDFRQNRLPRRNIPQTPNGSPVQLTPATAGITVAAMGTRAWPGATSR